MMNISCKNKENDSKSGGRDALDRRNVPLVESRYLKSASPTSLLCPPESKYDCKINSFLLFVFSERNSLKTGVTKHVSYWTVNQV